MHQVAAVAERDAQLGRRHVGKDKLAPHRVCVVRMVIGSIAEHLAEQASGIIPGLKQSDPVLQLLSFGSGHELTNVE